MPRKKGTKKAGDQVGFKLKEDESPLILDWVNEQSIFAESIRYLIEKEIAENGIRDLKQVMKQGFSYYRHDSIQNLNSVKTANAPYPMGNLNNNQIKNLERESLDSNDTMYLPGEHQENAKIQPKQESSVQSHLTESPKETFNEEASSASDKELHVQQEEHTNEESSKKEDFSEESQSVYIENNQPKKGPRSARRKTNLFG